MRQIELSFADNKKSYTKAFARYVLELSSKMTIKDIASHLNTSWDLIKSIQKEDFKRKYKNIKFGKLKRIGIDEISIAKGHKDMTIVMDLDSGKIVYANKGKGSDSLTEFFKKLKASKAKIKAVSMAFIKKTEKY
ncbi:MAG: helix-turn-helix domain-containing protein [Desulforegulaceae bacterium]|nr:helix-turn-helix domain-containing protein [Desulforegulaceae bacterium]